MAKNNIPTILVCNDDGVNAPGIEALIEVAKEFGNVFVVAPDKAQSGMAHAITINHALRVKSIKKTDDLTIYSTSGTPVDCVKLAIAELMPHTPDLVISGINHGSNASINVMYSGTMSAAIEASMEGLDAIGFSLDNFSIDADFSASKKIARAVIDKVLQNKLPKGTCLNINIPDLPSDLIKGIKICTQAKATWNEQFEERLDPFKQPYYWLKGSFVNQDSSENSDLNAIKNGYASIVPIQFDLTAHHQLQSLTTIFDHE